MWRPQSPLEALIWDAMRFVTSADAAYRYLREQGYEFTRAAVREAWKVVGESTGWSRVILNWGLDRAIPRAWQMIGPAGMTTPYQMIVKARAYDPVLGQYFEWNITYKTKEPVAYSSLYESAIERLSDSLEAHGLEPVEFGVTIRRRLFE